MVNILKLTGNVYIIILICLPPHLSIELRSERHIVRDESLVCRVKYYI